MKERLEYILNHLGITKKAFAEAIGLSASTITDFLKGRSKELSSSTIISMNKAYNINPTWFLTGVGEIFLNKVVEADMSKTTSAKKTNGLEGIDGNVEEYPYLMEVEQITRTGWWKKLDSEGKYIESIVPDLTPEARKRIKVMVEYELRVQEQLEKDLAEEVKFKYQKGEAG
jgi:transcriptional regulator with XRE-family HTH domain